MKAVVRMRLLRKDIDPKQDGGIIIYEDKKGDMTLAKNTGYRARTKPIDIRYNFFIREKVTSGGVWLECASTTNQLAGYLTKALSPKILR
ncbi:uncharacterized protein PITG_21978 [Phytophthora infestans T30-4]|uniref:Uncharacterized protein n=1 Tax=Phytophthora infestans (strain T30-4) TaxID=403677 RepID=D0P4T7_PHYIT|nr:uncharacterized protein PITG_21978 [Phytophthora infestans T30-4]EEY69654.1 hypothetical protein PITG_21978 [Phytophthora infestans T30-4]|eukprot:XP_002996864.1 hypothetical protein PITG_21978 [Phytophthora infestans T30-4]